MSTHGEGWEKKRVGFYAGSFLKTNGDGDSDGTYSEMKGYVPQGDCYWEVRLRANEEDPRRRVEVAAV